MFIIHITPECAPVAKAGGLGDVVQGLANEVAIRGNEVEVILPKYDCMRYDRIWGLQKTYSDLWVPYYEHWVHCDVYFGFADGVKCFFIEAHNDFFHRGCLYGEADDVQRFAFFSRAALEFILKTGKNPDIIHCHDWQTALVPVLLFELYTRYGLTHPRVCYTLHNLGHQGITGEFVLRQVGLDPAHYMTHDRLLDNFNPQAINLMKGGIIFSNFITTVSPHYMEEIRYSEQGKGLQHTLHLNEGKLGGILNGVDYASWNPENDPHIPYAYSADALEDKFKNKIALRQRLFLRDDYSPIVAVIARLDAQKGVQLIRHALFYCLANGCQFVLLGSATDPAIKEEFWPL